MLQTLRLTKILNFSVIKTLFSNTCIAIFRRFKKIYKAGNIYLSKVYMHAKFHANILIRKCCISQGGVVIDREGVYFFEQTKKKRMCR